MLITDLTSTNLGDITNCFNAAFSDYIIQFTATEEYLRNRWEAAGVNFDLSFGAFIDQKLVGFIIHGVDNWSGLKTAFNVGTGVVPEHRGKKIVKKLYDHSFPILKSHGIEQCRLEVIQSNEKALRAYKSIGFKEDRELICFAYKRNQTQHEISPVKRDQLKIKNNISNVEWNILKTFWDFKPSWENSISCITRKLDNYQFFG
ncbi:MAG: GNAT family N-acetyltransferase, partial [Candidatus Hodarchaeota archaeon]